MHSLTNATTRGATSRFLDQFGQHVTGVLHGFDRVRFRATLRMFFDPRRFDLYLGCCRVLLKDFGTFAQRWTDRVRAAAYARFEQAGRPCRYLGGGEVCKEELARQIAREDEISAGPVALFACVEPCLSYRVRGDRQTRQIHLALETRKCTHLYHYQMHPEFGLVHVRVQTWFPFTVDLCLNGREWLARQMDRAGLAYRQRDNCFVWVEDAPRAQALLEEQRRGDWVARLQPLLEEAHPWHREISAPMAGLQYYWTASQSEYATDVLFDTPANLAELYPRFLQHAVRSFGSPDVLRFLGRRVEEKTGAVPVRFKGEVTTSLKTRPEGVRLRHTLNGNSLKIYDKEGSVLRVETTIVHPEQFVVWRPKEGDEGGQKSWRKLRRGVADLWRRGEVSAAANARYLQALASVSGGTALAAEAAAVCQPVRIHGRRYRALNPLNAEDGRLLEAISRGEFVLQGLRNRDLCKLLHAPSSCPKTQRRRAAAITRKLALLRAHGLLKKIPKTHRYQVTANGRRILTALLAARQADTDQLTKLAA